MLNSTVPPLWNWKMAKGPYSAKQTPIKDRLLPSVFLLHPPTWRHQWTLVKRYSVCRDFDQFNLNSQRNILLLINSVWKEVARENSRYFATPPLVSLQNDIWEMSAEIPYWWPWFLPRSGYNCSVFWLVILHGKSAPGNQKHYPDLGSDRSSSWNFSTFFSDVLSQGNQCWGCKMLAVFSG